MNSSPFVFLCRPGFENDCAAEVQAFANTCDIAGYANTQALSGMVKFFVFDEQSGQDLFSELHLNDLIFVRQWFWTKFELNDLALEDRVSPIVEACSSIAMAQDLLVEHCDDESGRELSKFCKKISTPLRIAMEKKNLFLEDSEFQLHVLFLKNNSCLVGYSPVGASSPEKGGIIRLKFPKDAPSRSTLKLEEAILVLMSTNQRHSVLRLGNTAVDLGAAPGGWTYQLVQHGLQVTAIDNGPMDKKLMATEHVDHLRENALTWKPKKPVNMLICDMVEKPSLVAKLMAKWLAEGWTEQAIFNLKLPMKKRFQEVSECIDMICDTLEEAEVKYYWQAKHLYHDREEITVYFRRNISKAYD